MLNYLTNIKSFCLRLEGKRKSGLKTIIKLRFMYCNYLHLLSSKKLLSKLKKILKGSLEWVPSPLPSVKIQIMVKKFARVEKSKHCWVLSTNFENKKFVDIPQQCLALLSQVKFPAYNSNFH